MLDQLSSYENNKGFIKQIILENFESYNRFEFLFIYEKLNLTIKGNKINLFLVKNCVSFKGGLNDCRFYNDYRFYFKKKNKEWWLSYEHFWKKVIKVNPTINYDEIFIKSILNEIYDL